MRARAILIALALLACFVRVPATWVERFYSRGVYAWLQPIVTGVSNRVPFALFDLLLVATATLALVATVRAVGRAWRRRAISQVGRFGLNVLAVASLVYLMFLGAWGLNYRREPLVDRLAFNQVDVSHDRLVRLAEEAVAQLNRLHDRAHREGFPAWERLRPALEPAFRSLHLRLAPGTRPRPGVPKWSVLSYFFDRAGVSGMTDPFFLEVLVDRDLLPFERPFVLAHEWSHLAGHADEAEANFLGWMTCVHGGAPAAYSGWLYLYSEALASLPRSDRSALVRALAPGPRADLTAVAERARRIQPALQSASWRVYDRYLKANRVEEGVASYDRALLLVLGTRFEDGWTPVLRSSE
jgi:hypothetical protein